MERNEVLWIADAPVRAMKEAMDGGRAMRVERDPAAALVPRSGLPPIAIIIALPLRGWSILDLIARAARAYPGAPVIVQTGESSMAAVGRLIRAGAAAVLESAVAWDEIDEEIRGAGAMAGADPVSQGSATSSWTSTIVGSSRRMKEVVDFVSLVGPRKCTVLITGETGTGKEVIARAIHSASPRARRKMVSFCCTAVPEHLLESELFGHVKGAFTGAIGQRAGRFEQAHGSTLFLDEIGDMPLDLQAKLLRVLQEREFQRLGSSESIHVDVRVVAATNADLERKVAQGRFREDLYYRIAVAVVRLPSLRDRIEDVPALAEHFLGKICSAEGIPSKAFSAECLESMMRYQWPGNVRQLENAVEAAVALSGERNVLHSADFWRTGMPAGTVAEDAEDVSLPEGGLDFAGTVNRIERRILEQALIKTKGNKKMAADLLGLKRTTLSAKLRSLGSYSPAAWGAAAVN
jgi:DNA-binding NtrC family response regulator